MKINKQKKYCLSIIATIFLLAIDQISKYWATNVLKDNAAIHIIKQVFSLQYLENRGAAFGMMEGQFLFFYCITPIIISIVILILVSLPDNPRFNFLWCSGILLIAGSLGNLIDRIFLNYVVDFLYFNLIDFPIFNIADIYVCVATGIYIFLLLFYYTEEELNEITIIKKRK